jgi:hypothetical protein
MLNSLRCSLWKLVCLVLIATIAALFTAALATAQAPKDAQPPKDKDGKDKEVPADELLDLPRFKRSTLIRAGYTRPGNPNDKIKDGKVIPVAWDFDYKGRYLGGTVYFAVFERTGYGADGDVFGTGRAGIDDLFKEGRSTSGAFSPAFDASARFLYLYQVVNDRGLDPLKDKVIPAKERNLRTEDIITSTVKLLVHPRDITSWGHFENVAFTSKVADRDLKGDIVLAGGNKERILQMAFSSNPAILDSLPYYEYSAISPAFSLRQLKNYFNLDKSNLNLTQSKTYTELKAVKNPLPWEQNMITAANGGFEPAYVQIVPADLPPYGPVLVDLPLESNLMDPLAVGRLPARAYLKVDWRGDKILKVGEHSVVFGFTSNLPPTDEVVRVISPAKEMPAGQAAEGIRAVALVDGNGPGVGAGQAVAPGTVPTPIPPAAVGLAGGGFGSWLGGQFVSGGGGFGGGFGPGVGGFGVAPPVATGGGVGGGTGGGGNQTPNTSQTTPAQAGQQNQTLTNTTTVFNQQQQQQQQQQRQSQHQHQHQHQSNNNRGQVVPEPAAIVLGLLGVPALILALRRRKAGKLSQTRP